jgi:ornithine carbamoyltransferase
VTVRHFLSVLDLGPANLAHLVDRSLAIAEGRQSPSHALDGRIVGVYFQCPSTRTRTAFTVGALRMGAKVISYNPGDLQIATGETLHDSGRVLSGFLDAMIIRTNRAIAEMEVLAGQSSMAVINAMSENEHPTQAIADLVTIRQALGRLDRVHILYVGEGNNTASALALAASMTAGMRLTVVSPKGYGLPKSVLNRVCVTAKENGGCVEHHHNIDDLPKNVDVVYATRWETMGEPKAEPGWREKFIPYSVTPALMARVSRSSGDTIFLHDLPAVRGADVFDEVLDGPQSRAFQQARNKMTSAMAILEWCLAA